MIMDANETIATVVDNMIPKDALTAITSAAVDS